MCSASSHREIKRLHEETVLELAEKGVEYAELRTGLTPSLDKHEAGFIYDSTLADSSFYGGESMNHVLPLLDHRSSHSVLHGDLLGKDQRFISGLLEKHMILCRPFTFRHSTLLFCIYLNNLSDMMLSKLHQALSGYKAYVGYVPATFSTFAKTYLSTTLGSAFFKLRSQIILPREDETLGNDTSYLSPYSFDKNIYRITTIPSIKYSLFLAFKIERPLYNSKEDDAYFSVNALSETIVDINSCEIILKESKFIYLLREKKGKFEKAGLANITREDLIAMITSKITSNYIYNLAFLPVHNTLKFNIMIEIPHGGSGYPTKVTVALEYIPEEKVIRVITMY